MFWKPRPPPAQGIVPLPVWADGVTSPTVSSVVTAEIRRERPVVCATYLLVGKQKPRIQTTFCKKIRASYVVLISTSLRIIL